jgi:hypothetical protein
MHARAALSDIAGMALFPIPQRFLTPRRLVALIVSGRNVVVF